MVNLRGLGGGSPASAPVAVVPGNPPARGASNGAITRTGADTVPAFRTDPGGSNGFAALFLPVLEGSPGATTTTLAAAPDAAGRGPARGAAVLEDLNGNGPPHGRIRLAIADREAKPLPDERSSASVPRGPVAETGEDEVQLAVGGRAPGRAGDRCDVPDPQVAGLITRFLPLDHSSLEHAIDRFLDSFDGLGTAVPGLQGPMYLVPASLALAITVLALDVAIRLRWSPCAEREGDVDEGLSLFPGLPGLSSGSQS